MSDVMFTLNTAESGGAVGLTSTEWAIADFRRCRFESNNGTRGGAIYLDGEGHRIIKDSSFRLNIAGESSSRYMRISLAIRISTMNNILYISSDGYRRSVVRFICRTNQGKPRLLKSSIRENNMSGAT